MQQNFNKSMGKYKNQFLFFLSLLLSAFGYEFIYFIMTVHIYDLSKNALNIGIFTALTFIPKLFSSIIGGIADKIGKVKCFAISAFLICLLLLAMSLLNNIIIIYMIWLIASIFFTIIINVRGSLIAEIVSNGNYVTGNALALTLLNTAKLLGPLLGGIVVMIQSIQLLLYITILVYFLVGLGAIKIKISASNTSYCMRLKETTKKGLKFIRENEVYFILAKVGILWRLILGFQLTLFVVYIKSFLGGSSSQYGIFMTILGIGSIAGSMAGPYVSKRIKPLPIIVSGLSFHYFSFILLSYCHNFTLSLIIIFTSYAAFYISLVMMHSARDKAAPSEIRSCVYGTITTILTPPAILSMLAGSYLIDRYSVDKISLYAGITALISFYVILLLDKKGTDQLQKPHIY
jgi:MFS family permease